MGRRYLLVCDADGSLSGDEPALRRLQAWLEPRRAKWLVAYTSRQFFESVTRSAVRLGLPAPDFVIGGLGTEIRRYPDGTHLRDPQDLHSPGWNPARVIELLADVAELELHTAACQSTCRISYRLDDAELHLLEHIERRLLDNGIRADLMYSSARDLDIVPVGVNPGSAVRYVADNEHIDPDRIVVCGNTGFDVALFEQGFNGIVVPDASPGLAALVGETVYHAKRPGAAGVLEGIEYWLHANRHATRRRPESVSTSCDQWPLGG